MCASVEKDLFPEKKAFQDIIDTLLKWIKIALYCPLLPARLEVHPALFLHDLQDRLSLQALFIRVLKRGLVQLRLFVSVSSHRSQVCWISQSALWRDKRGADGGGHIPRTEFQRRAGFGCSYQRPPSCNLGFSGLPYWTLQKN